MRSHHTLLTLAAAFVVTAIPVTSAQTLRLPLAPLRLPTSSSATSSSSSSVSSSATSSSSTSNTAKPQDGAGKFSKNPGVSAYCMNISTTLMKASSIKADDATMAKVDQTVDFLKKAEAICASMGYNPPIVFTDGTFSSSEGPTFVPESSTLSSSSSPFIIEGNSQLCTLIGKAGKRGGIQMCRYDCSGKMKVMKCQ